MARPEMDLLCGDNSPYMCSICGKCSRCCECDKVALVVTMSFQGQEKLHALRKRAAE